MRGSSQSCLVQAEDGNFYILKMSGNPQGSEILWHEVLGTELMRHLGLPVPAWSLVELSSTFINSNPGMWFELARSNPQQPPPGLHFGSRLISGPDGISYEFLPKTWLRHIVNRADFIGASLFDLWAEQDDRRQAMFVPSAEHSNLEAVFIDQGSLFSVPSDTLSRRCIRAMFWDPAIYRDLNFEEGLPFWETRIRNLNVALCLQELRDCGLPGEWYIANIVESLVSALVERQAHLEEYSYWIRTVLGGANCKSQWL